MREMQAKWLDFMANSRGSNSSKGRILHVFKGMKTLYYRSISLSSTTACSEARGLIVKKFQLPGKASEYYLVEVSEECETKTFCLSF